MGVKYSSISLMASHCAERKKNKERETFWGQSHFHTSIFFHNIHCKSFGCSLYFPHDAPICSSPTTSEDYKLCLQMKSGDWCHSHAGVWYATFEFLRKQTICFKFPDDCGISNCIICDTDGVKAMLTVTDINKL